MEVSQIVAGIDAQIKTLTEARNLLASMGTPAVKAGRGRPKGSKNAVAAPAIKSAVLHPRPRTKTAATPAKTKRQLSPEGRKRIADAMKRRWAARRTEQGK